MPLELELTREEVEAGICNDPACVPCKFSRDWLALEAENRRLKEIEKRLNDDALRIAVTCDDNYRKDVKWIRARAIEDFRVALKGERP